jgi:hypothetical protein
MSPSQYQPEARSAVANKGGGRATGAADDAGAGADVDVIL